MQRLSRFLCCAFVTASPAFADGDYNRGKVLAKQWECTNCHGLTGNERWPDTPGLAAVPMLAGQPAKYLVKSLREFGAGDRIDDSELKKMSLISQSLNDQDMEDIAAYFSAQKRY